MFGNKRRRASATIRRYAVPGSVRGTAARRRRRSILRRRRAAKARRGVLLLVVLSLLVLFMMVGTAFLLAAKQAEKAGKASSRGAIRTARGDAQGDLLDEAVLQLVRDTRNPLSIIRGHGLLNDAYGTDGFMGVVASPSASFAGATAAGGNPTGGQFLEFTLQLNTGAQSSWTLKDLNGNFVDAAGNPVALSTVDNAYNGQVITFLSGRARNHSTRIVGFVPPNLFRVMNFELDGGALVSDPTILNGARILVNGRPFNGTGAGLNPVADVGDPRLNAEDMSIQLLNGEHPPLALLPNATFLTPSVEIELHGTPIPPSGKAIYYPFNTLDWVGRGGADESYDAVDFQNMALAYVPGVGAVETVLPMIPSNQTPLPTELGTMILPSFHRPELINYWAAEFDRRGSDIRNSTLAANPMMLRRVLMRPSWLDHPNFTGSNPEHIVLGTNPNDAAANVNKLVRMVYGPWDVDNDNDGVRDSIWVDVGLPVMAGVDGRLVKPLAAFMVVDLDGRLNVNAHGTQDLAEISDASLQRLSNVMPTGAALASGGGGGPMTSDKMPRGMGMGPADISLEPAIGGDFRRLLRGDVFTTGATNVYLPGRYGIDDSGGIRRAGWPMQYDLMAQIGLAGMPRRANQLSAFVSPPDLRARYGVGLNDFGQPVFEATLQPVITSPSDDLAADSPYELNLSKKTAAGAQGWQTGQSSADAPFTIAELEKVLRIHDADAGSLPPRLALLSGISRMSNPSDGDLSDRLKITTDQYDLPVPNVSLPSEMEGMLSPDPQIKRLPRSAAEVFEIRVRKALGLAPFPAPLAGDPTDPTTEAGRVRFILRRIVAPELADGKRLNINRPLGNGYDDNQNGVVDEPLEGDTNFDGNIDPQEGEPAWRLPNQQDPAMMAAGAASASFGAPLFPLFALDVVPSNKRNSPNGELVEVDHRQLLARHIYTLALTLVAPATFGDGTKADEDAELARRLAQWAVNVVDFRDPDNIMTPFEYDVNPFDGWDDAIDGATNGTYQQNSPINFVWGAERPELVMTETLAWHDRRTDDSAQEDVYPAGGQANIMKTSDPADPDKDADYDQLVRPRGALFIELYNPWGPIPAANADTHDRKTSPGFDMGVDLGAISGSYADRSKSGLNADPRDPNASPVWRMAIYKRQGVVEAEAGQWDPDSIDQNRQPRGVMNRSVYFSGFAAKDPNDGVAFFNKLDRNQPNQPGSNPVPPVRPGRFLVVGSGDEMGAGNYEAPIGDRKSRNPANVRPQRRIELVTKRAGAGQPATRMADADDQAMQDTMGNYPVQAPADDGMDFADGTRLERVNPNDTSTSIADVAIIDQVEGDSDRRRLTLSEPAIGYPKKFRAAEWDQTMGQYEAQGAAMAIDIPLDGPIGGQDALDAQGVDWPYDYPIDPVLTQIREARPDQGDDPRGDPGAFYSYIYLQRLANPLIPWNPEPGKPGHDAQRPVNPYLTVDAMPANLTVFNSRGDDRGREEDDKDANEPRNNFASVQRGYTSRTHNAQNQGFMPSIWGREAPSMVRARPGRFMQDMLVTPRNEYRQMNLQRTNDFWFNAVPSHTLGFLNRPMQDPAATARQRQIKPVKPYEWLTWNNRPYAGANELLMVPRYRSSQIMPRFTNAETTPQGWNPYDPQAEVQQAPQGGPQPKPGYAHLMSFFYERIGQNQPPPAVPLKLYRLLDYVHTPSLFVGTETWLNPSTTMFGAPRVNWPNRNDPTDPRVNFQAPFNAVSEFRDPGKVNINTLASKDVWDGLFHGSAKRDRLDDNVHPGPDDDELAASRRGYGNQQTSATALDPGVPTMFANPFRAADAGDLVPLDNMRKPGVDVTLLRSLGGITQGPAGGAAPQPLFSVNLQQPREFNNEDRNAYFRYAPMMRMANLTTTRSNVYAVWVTIGFFEVDPAPTKQDFSNNNGKLSGQLLDELYQRVYPDGYQFGREAGSETGEIRRLRSFYIIDRSLPAAFEPGVDHNVENVIRLRRRIQ
jgi:hypothetical protein